MQTTAGPLLDRALALYKQNQLNQALVLFRKLDPTCSHPDIAPYIKTCIHQLARKFWCMALPHDLRLLSIEVKTKGPLRLAAARLYGKTALSEFAKEQLPLLSHLAYCSTISDLVLALTTLGEVPELTALSKGWLALIEGQPQQAKEWFQQSGLHVPQAAMIGLGVAELLLDHRAQAQVHLQPLQPFAMKRFPCLFQATGWGSPDAHREQLYFYLFKASLQDLRRIEQQQMPANKHQQSWIYLRIGDYLALQLEETALSYWALALNANSSLKLDILKRRYLAALTFHKSRDFSKVFFDFYEELCRVSPQMAQQFVEHLAFSSKQDLSAKLHHSELRTDQEVWAVRSPSPHLQLLWLHLFWEQEVHPLENLLWVSKEIVYRKLYYPWREFEKLFALLDPLYGHHELYLEKKLSISRLFNSSAHIRAAIILLLQLNPHRQEELIPVYFKAAFERGPFEISRDQLADWLELRKQREAVIFKEVEALRQLFPNQFDLIRLFIYCHPGVLFNEDVVSLFAPNLSKSLLAVLCFQIAIDRGLPIRVCKKRLPAPDLYGKSREADWRLVAALSEPNSKFPKKQIEEICNALAPDSKTKHDLFLPLTKYNQTPPGAILRKWKQQARADFFPYYHLALLEGFKENGEACLSLLEQARYLASPEDVEYRKMGFTLQFNDKFHSSGDFFSQILERLLGENS